MNNAFINDIRKINKDIIKLNVSFKNLNTMKLDGLVKYLIKPTSFIELKKVLIVINKYNIKYFILGNGSNVLLTEKCKECIIKLNFIKSKFDNILYSNELLPILANKFSSISYSGLEYLSMIPASVGGAIVMNAGSYNHYISDIIEYVYYLDEKLKFKVIKKEECDFSYRTSIFKRKKYIVLGCKVKLIREEKEIINQIMNECKNKRKVNQPIEYPNSGSIFKNGNNYSAWELIDKIGLRGYKKDGAKISEKHCNFIVNFNNASFKDIMFLIQLIEVKVKEKFDICLEREIIIID